ncbi:glutamine amidotransferase [Maribius pontilimi]|uniref:Glutamine amidotransferase n=1 Tax=Palleronia pontilimi TaxID=1964209 RepID=A0A934MCR1_9RHOB|nr:glutamine amidotransferase [Palleronia pontilimi]
MKPVLVLQGRPEDLAADEEFDAILTRGGLSASDTLRVRLEREGLPDGLSLDDVSATIMGGGPACVSDPQSVQSDEEARIVAALRGLLTEICGRDLPFLGICYGIGGLADFLGARVSKDRWSEPVSIARCEVTEDGQADPLLAGVPDRFGALVAHKEAVQELPEGCAHLVSADACPFQMIRFGRHVYATQFHPEADGDSFALRIGVYADRGYFAPDEAEAMIAVARSEPVDASHRVLANFTRRYCRADVG